MQASDVSPDVEAAIASNTTPDQRHFAEFAARISWDPEQVGTVRISLYSCNGMHCNVGIIVHLRYLHFQRV